MAGISDRPFRSLCKDFGAGFAVSEMVASNPALRDNKKTLLKADHDGEHGLCSVQIVGTEPSEMAEAAAYNVECGAKIIDINMGCPAKKVCSKAAGSALLKDVELVKRILDSVVNAVDVPVTLKIRTGWDIQNRNAVEIAQIAEQSGIAALTVHGRTRACKFEGNAEYETIKNVKQTVKIPVIANGDIDSASKAKLVLESTGADAVMIGRAAQGNPWLFRQIEHYANFDELIEKPSMSVIYNTIVQHLEKLYSFYGDCLGVKIARKHIGWYFNNLEFNNSELKAKINQAIQPTQQLLLVKSAFTL
jgi:tRNA-dihydrouridine synthase B